MLPFDFLNLEDKKEFEILSHSKENFEQKVDKLLFFFDKIMARYNDQVCSEILAFFISHHLANLNSQLISFFYMEVFGLRAPHYCGNDEDEIRYVVRPSQTLIKLYQDGFDISKIIGGVLQLDHQGDMGYQLSQIIEFLFLNTNFAVGELIIILKKIIQSEYASCVRMGRFLGFLIQYSVLKTQNIIEIIHILSFELNLEVKLVSDILIGAHQTSLSNDIKLSLIGHSLKLFTPDLKFLEDPTYVSNQLIGLAMVISNFLYENRSLSHFIGYINKIGASSVISEAFKYLIDNSYINIKRIGKVLYQELYNRNISFSEIASFISVNFSFYEIANFLSTIIINDFINIPYDTFIDILRGFCDNSYHGFTDSDFIQLLNQLHKINPKLLNDMNIKDFETFVSTIKLEKNY